jgi:hypothetical protein
MIFPNQKGDDYKIMIARPAKPFGRASSPLKNNK